MHVCVIGAGIVGLASGYALQQAGYEVSLVERAEAPAMGASGGNGAQLSYAYVQPLADPGIWASLPKLLLDKTSPLHMRWQLDPHQWSWLLQFLGACNAASSRATTQSLLTLAAQSRAALEATLQREQLNCDFHTPGKLVLQSTQVGLDGAARQLQLQAQLGGPQQHMVDAAEVARLEPALQHYVSQIAGAVYTPSECAIDCRKLCEALLALLRQRGAQVLLGCEVQQFQTQGSRITGVQTTRVCTRPITLCSPGMGKCATRAPAGREAVAGLSAQGLQHHTGCRCCGRAAAARERDRQQPQGGVCAHWRASARGGHGGNRRGRPRPASGPDWASA